MERKRKVKKKEMYTSFLRLLAGNKFSTLSICFFFLLLPMTFRKAVLVAILCKGMEQTSARRRDAIQLPLHGSGGDGWRSRKRRGNNSFPT